MSDASKCKLTGCRCFRTRYGRKPCSENPQLSDAANCIAALDDAYLDLENELRAMDVWVDALREPPADSQPSTKFAN